MKKIFSLPGVALTLVIVAFDQWLKAQVRAGEWSAVLGWISRVATIGRYDNPSDFFSWIYFLAASGFIAFLSRRAAAVPQWMRLCQTVFIAGMLCGRIESSIWGSMTDFIHFDFWLVFWHITAWMNVTDAALFLSVLIIAAYYYAVRKGKNVRPR